MNNEQLIIKDVFKYCFCFYVNCLPPLKTFKKWKLIKQILQNEMKIWIYIFNDQPFRLQTNPSPWPDWGAGRWTASPGTSCWGYSAAGHAQQRGLGSGNSNKIYLPIQFFSWKYLCTDIVGDLDPLAAVLELPVVWGGVVPALGGAVGGEGDGAAGARVDVALDPGHHRVLGTWHSTRAGQWARVTWSHCTWHVARGQVVTRHGWSSSEQLDNKTQWEWVHLGEIDKLFGHLQFLQHRIEKKER